MTAFRKIYNHSKKYLFPENDQDTQYFLQQFISCYKVENHQTLEVNSRWPFRPNKNDNLFIYQIFITSSFLSIKNSTNQSTSK